MVKYILIVLSFFLFFSSPSFSDEVLDENWMCGQDVNGDDYFQEDELSACISADKSLCPIGAVECEAKEDTYIYDASFNCPENYNYNASTTFCELTVKEEVIRTCPVGYSLQEDGQCQKTNSTSVILTCPSGFSRSGGTCEKFEYSDGQLYCPSTWSLNGNQCTKSSKVCKYNYAKDAYLEIRATPSPTSALLSVVVMDNGSRIFYPQGVGVPARYSKGAFKYQEWVGGSPWAGGRPNPWSMIHEICVGSGVQSTAASMRCPSGYTQHGSSCEKAIIQPASESCPAGYFQSGDQCFQTLTAPSTDSCPAEYSPSDSDSGCERLFTSEPNIVCPSGSVFNESDQKCERVDAYNQCPLDGSRSSCKADGSGRSYCSPNKCVDFNSLDNLSEDGPDGTMLVDDGLRSEGGACMEDIYIYSGIASRCKLNGFDSAYKNCCKDADATLQDGSGGYAVYLEAGWSTIKGAYAAVKAAHDAYKAYTLVGGAASAAAGEAAAGAAQEAFTSAFDPTSLAISIAVMIVMDWIANACDEMDTSTAINKASGYCHEVGTYCQKEVKFLGCVQKAEGHCCFNSKLARIIQEQGRPQLTTFSDGWGKPESPNCRGFTPEEFQQLDFSEIDLSEYVDDLAKDTQQQLEANVTQATEEFFNNIK